MTVRNHVTNLQKKWDEHIPFSTSSTMSILSISCLHVSSWTFLSIMCLLKLSFLSFRTTYWSSGAVSRSSRWTPRCPGQQEWQDTAINELQGAMPEKARCTLQHEPFYHFITELNFFTVRSRIIAPILHKDRRHCCTTLFDLGWHVCRSLGFCWAIVLRGCAPILRCVWTQAQLLPQCCEGLGNVPWRDG